MGFAEVVEQLAPGEAVVVRQLPRRLRATGAVNLECNNDIAHWPMGHQRMKVFEAPRRTDNVGASSSSTFSQLCGLFFLGTLSTFVCPGC